MNPRPRSCHAVKALGAVLALGAGTCWGATALADGPPSLVPAGEAGSGRSVLWNNSPDTSRWSVGVAVGQRPLPPGQIWSPNPLTGAPISGAQSAGEASVVLGMGLTRPRPMGGTSARLVYQAPLTQRADATTPAALAAANAAGAVDPNGVPQRMRMGLVLTPADPLAELRGGAITKVQLSGHMALSLRPRAGGVWLSLNGKW
jgi:hypothetical protein